MKLHNLYKYFIITSDYSIKILTTEFLIHSPVTEYLCLQKFLPMYGFTFNDKAEKAKYAISRSGLG
jgi:hypothetical protein